MPFNTVQRHQLVSIFSAVFPLLVLLLDLLLVCSGTTDEKRKQKMRLTITLQPESYQFSSFAFTAVGINPCTPKQVQLTWQTHVAENDVSNS